MKFPFTEPQNTAVFTCKHIIENMADICYVSHDEEDGAWQFLCGSDNHLEVDAKIVSLNQVFIMDQSIGQLAEMPMGCYAVRENKSALWLYYKK